MRHCWAKHSSGRATRKALVGRCRKRWPDRPGLRQGKTKNRSAASDRPAMNSERPVFYPLAVVRLLIGYATWFSLNFVFILVGAPVLVLLTPFPKAKYWLLHFLVHRYLAFFTQVWSPGVGIYQVAEITGHQLNEPAIYVANHRGFLDAPFLLGLLPRTGALVKSRYTRWMLPGHADPALRFCQPRSPLARLGARGHPTIPGFYRGRTAACSVFPEGTRTRTGKLGRFKNTAFRVAIESRVPVAPVVVHSTLPFMAKAPGSFFPRQRIVFRIRFLDSEPVLADDSASALADRVYLRMSQELKRLDEGTVWEAMERTGLNPHGPFEQDEITAILPHRPPFLFVDRVAELVPFKSIVAERTLRPEEPHFTGHFPEQAIVPGVLITEALAQTSGLLLGLDRKITAENQPAGGRFYLADTHMKFLSPGPARSETHPGSGMRARSRPLVPVPHVGPGRKTAHRHGHADLGAGGRQAMKVLLVRANPRKEGFTQHLTNLFVEGVRATDAELADVDLTALSIEPCVGCYRCWVVHPGLCIHGDAMAGLLQAVVESQVIVCATPLYFFSMSSYLKVFLERLLPLSAQGLEKSKLGLHRNRIRYPGKWARKCLITIVTGTLPDLAAYENIQAAFRLIADTLDMELGGQLIRPESYLLPYRLSKPRTLKRVEAAFSNAGREAGATGRLSAKTVADAGLRLATDDDQFRNSCEIYWKHAMAAGASAGDRSLHTRVGNDPDILMREMAHGVDPQTTARLRAVFQFDFPDQKRHYRLTVDRGRCEMKPEATSHPDLRVTCSADAWVAIFTGQLSVTDALRQRRLAIEGDKSLFTRMARYFPPPSA